MRKKNKPVPVRRRTDPLSVEVLKSFRIIYGSVRQHFRNVRQATGISGSQVWILHEVMQTPGIGVSELAVKLAIHQSTCSQLVEKLVRAELMAKTRSSDDQRRVGLSVTARGKRTLAAAPGPAEGLLPEAIAEISPAARRGLQRGLKQIIKALDLKDDASATTPLADL
jgi:MarR family transcriptional regulator, organic hydroperoxide resistance regulator